MLRRRDLDRVMVDDGSDRAVLDITSSASAVVATSISVHRAADDARFLNVAIGQREQACNFAITELSGIGQMRQTRHR